MKNLLSIPLIFILGLLISCQDDPPPVPIPGAVPTDWVDFSNLKIGQTTTFILYLSDCSQLEEEFTFTGDTLVLEVIDQNGQLHLQESLTRGSSGYEPSNEAVRYPVESKDGIALLPDRQSSSLFFFYANDTLRLNPTQTEPLKQDGCQLVLDKAPFIGNDIGFVSDFAFGDVHLKEKIAVSCEPYFDLDAYLLYDARHLYMSHKIMEERILGWIALQD
ncbi:MAG: hypothetical protein AAF587_42095 [Bacteroidota bacterium]